jgi:type IV pilus assembly protein PilA
MKRKMQKGFTLIELMIVIAIVAILVALAVPAYQDYVIRSKVAECINGAAVAKLQISEYRETVGTYPGDATVAGVASPAGTSQFCTGFAGYTTAGIFQIDVNETAIDSVALASITLQPQLEPTVNAQGGVDWECSRGNTTTTGVKYLPSTCRGT